MKKDHINPDMNTDRCAKKENKVTHRTSGLTHGQKFFKKGLNFQKCSYFKQLLLLRAGELSARSAIVMTLCEKLPFKINKLYIHHDS